MKVEEFIFHQHGQNNMTSLTNNIHIQHLCRCCTGFQ